MSSALRKTGRFSAWAVVVAAALVALVVAVLQTPWAKDRIRREIVDRTNDAIDGRLQVRHLSGSLLWNATLEGVSLDDGRGRPLARIQRVDANYSLISLAWGHLEVDSVEIQHPRVLARRYPDGTLNFSTLVEPAEEEPVEEPSDFAVTVGRYDVEGGRIVWQDMPANESRTEADDLSDQLDRVVSEAPGDDAARALAEVRDAFERFGENATEPPTVAVVSDLQFAGTFAMVGTDEIDQSLESFSCSVDTDNLARTLEPALENWRLTYRPDRAEAELDTFEIGDGLEVTGLAAQATLGSTAEQPVRPEWLHARIEEVALHSDFGSLFVPGGRLESNITTQIEVGGRLEQLYGRISTDLEDAGELEVGARVAPLERPIDYEADVRVDDLKPGEIVELDGVEVPEGNLNAALRAEGTGVEPASAVLSTEFAVWESTIEHVRIDEMYGKAELDAGSARVERFVLLSSHLEARAQGSASADGTFDLRARTRSPKGGLSLADFGLTDGPELSLKRADTTIDVSGTIDTKAKTPVGLVRRIEGRSRWDLEEVRAFGNRIGASKGSAQFDLKQAGGGNQTDASDRRELQIAVDADGRDIAVPGLTVRNFQIDGSADGSLELDAAEPYRAVRRLETRWSGRVRGLRAGDLSVGNASFDATVQNTSGDGRFRGTLRADVGALQTGGVRVESAEGSWEGSATLRSGSGLPVRQFTASGSSTVSGIDAGAATVGRVETELDLSGSPFEPSGTVDSRIVDLVAGDRSFGESRVTVEATGDREIALTVRATPETAADRPYRLDARVGYEPSFTTFRLSAFEAGRPGQLWNLRQEATVTLLPGGVRFDGLELQNGEQRIAVNGAFRTAGSQDLDVTVERLDLAGLQELADLQIVPGLEGHVGLDLTLRGTASEPIVELGARGDELHALAYGPAGFETSLRSEGGWVELEQFSARLLDRTVGSATARLPLDWDLSGAWSFDRDADSRATAELEATTVQQLIRAVPALQHLPVEGTFGGSFEFLGTLDKPSVDSSFFVRDVSVHGDLAGTRVDIDGVHSETSFHFGERSEADKRVDFSSKLRWNAAELVAVALATDAPLVEWGVAVAQGELPVDEFADRLVREPLKFSAKLEETDLSKLPLEPLKEADAEGMVGGEFSVDGTLLEPKAEAQLNVDNFGWNQYRDIYLAVDASLASGTLDLQKFRVEWDAEEILVAHGTLPVPIAEVVRGETIEDVPLDLVVVLRPMSLMRLSAIDYSFNRFQGTLAGYLHLAGTVRSPQLDARASIRDAQFSTGERGTVGAWLHADTRGATGGALFCTDDDPILTAQFDLPLNLDPAHLALGNSPLRDGDVWLSVKGSNIPVEQIVPTPLVEDWISDPTGYLQADLEITGTWNDLQPSGRFALEEGGVTLVQYARRFENIEVETILEPERIRLVNLELEDGDRGTVQANGAVAIDRMVPQTFEGHIETKAFDAGTLTAGFPALVTSTTDITGQLREDRHDVQVDVASLNVELPESQQSGTHPTTMSEDIVVIEEHEAEETNRIDELLVEGSTVADVVNARIDVKVSRDSYIRHPNGFLRFAADIRADLRGTRMALSGKVDSVKGDFQFLGKDFQVDAREGIVRFTGANPPNPRLDIIAIHPLDRSIVAQMDPSTREKPRIFVRVRGTARAPTLDMTSEPTMSESEIIYVLMTGRPPSNAEVGQEEGVASQAAAAAGGLFSALLEQKISKNVPVDVLRFESGESGLRGSKVRVGKYITSDLFVSSAYRFGQDDSQGNSQGGGWETRVEWHFAPRWMIEAVYGDEQTGVLNTFWDVY